MRQSFWKKVLAAWLSFLLIFMASLVPGLDGTAAEGAVTVFGPFCHFTGSADRDSDL